MRYLLPYLNEFPPTLCRLLARRNRGRSKGCRFLSTREISFISGLPRSTVHELARQTDWADVPVATIHRFSMACGVNLLSGASRKRQRDFFKRRGLAYLKHAPKSQQPLIRDLLKLLASAQIAGRS